MSVFFGIDLDVKDFERVKDIAEYCFMINEKLKIVEVYETKKGYHLRFAPEIMMDEAKELMMVLSLVLGNRDIVQYFKFAWRMKRFVLRQTEKVEAPIGNLENITFVEAPTLVAIFSREDILTKKK